MTTCAIVVLEIDDEPSGRAMLALSPAPTAILALSDSLALEVLEAATRSGLRGPADPSGRRR